LTKKKNEETRHGNAGDGILLRPFIIARDDKFASSAYLHTCLSVH
jgi:hypothetical protein